MRGVELGVRRARAHDFLVEKPFELILPQACHVVDLLDSFLVENSHILSDSALVIRPALLPADFVKSLGCESRIVDYVLICFFGLHERVSLVCLNPVPRRELSQIQSQTFLHSSEVV